MYLSGLLLRLLLLEQLLLVLVLQLQLLKLLQLCWCVPRLCGLQTQFWISILSADQTEQSAGCTAAVQAGTWTTAEVRLMTQLLFTAAVRVAGVAGGSPKGSGLWAGALADASWHEQAHSLIMLCMQAEWTLCMCSGPCQADYSSERHKARVAPQVVGCRGCAGKRSGLWAGALAGEDWQSHDAPADPACSCPSH